MVYPWSKNCCVRMGEGHFDHKFKGGMGCRPPTTIGVIKILHHITPVLRSLHWLRITECIIYLRLFLQCSL